jgi:hypothetical protein
MEKLVVEALCPGSAVRTINCNGDEVSLEAIAKRVGSLARLVQKRFSPVVVVVDREARQDPSAKIKRDLSALLIREDINVPIVIGIPDRMIENWILADFEAIARCVKVKTKVSGQEFEGTSGEVKLKQLLPEDLTYVKTIHGVEWFQKCDAETIRQHSPSFRDFINAMTDVKCPWLAQKRLL